MIKVLEKQVADKIAAGEVVDRPLSVVKELVENSIDAGANLIVCEIKKGGKEYIRITDNGEGIPKDQVETAFLRHATSKIVEAEDLSFIETLGFRGEALASIAAISKLEIITRTKDQKAGLKIVMEGGTIISKDLIGCEVGTTIIVLDLFYNTPARLEFMKSDKAESSLIIEFMTHIALAYDHIKVRVVNNGTMLFSTRGTGDKLAAIATVNDVTFAKALLPVNAEEDGFKLTAYLSGPGESRANRRGQVFFVNGRVIDSKVLERAVDGAYRDRLFAGRHPIAYLFLETMPNSLDVNIHPNKREIRFHNERKVVDFVENSIRNGILVKESIPEIKGQAPPIKQTTSHPFVMDNKEQKREIGTLSKSDFSKSKTSVSTRPTVEIEEQVDVNKLLSTLREEKTKISDKVEQYTKESKPVEPTKTLDFSTLEYLGILFNTYILLSQDDSFYMVDQHAAHERIHFEKLMDTYNKEDKVTQTIMLPFTFDTRLTRTDWKNQLENFGFRVEEFGPETYAVREIPTSFTLEEAELFVRDFIDQVDEDTDFMDPSVVDKMASRACKKSVKGGDNLANEEVRSLLYQLSKCNNPYSCPHGRPTFIRMDKLEITRKFMRT